MNMFVPGVPREGRHQQNEIIYFLYSVFLFPRVIKCTNTQVQSVDAKPGTSVDPCSYSFFCIWKYDILDEKLLARQSHYEKLQTSLSLFFSFENVQFRLRYSQLPLVRHLVKADTCSWSLPYFSQSFTSSPSKVDISLRWTVGAGPESLGNSRFCSFDIKYICVILLGVATSSSLLVTTLPWDTRKKHVNL